MDFAPNAVIWVLSALSLSMLYFAVYAAIFFMILYAIAWGLIQVFRPIFRIINYGAD
jgi:hypothetical protein